jgi:hypothetical protein
MYSTKKNIGTALDKTFAPLGNLNTALHLEGVMWVVCLPMQAARTAVRGLCARPHGRF